MLCLQDEEILAEGKHKYRFLYDKRKNPTMKEM